MIPLLTEARTYITDSLHAAKQGQETHALVSAEAALHRLRSILSRQRVCYSKKNAENEQQNVLSFTGEQQTHNDLFTSNGN